MTVFREGSGNLLDADVDALVNTVNTVGVMGKGIALQFKNAFPANFEAYERACKRGDVQLGHMHVFDAGRLARPYWIINFPTKQHWRSRSKLSDIAAGLDDLRRVIKEHEITSIAIPPLGCGNGGLSWSDVQALIETELNGVEADVVVYAPAGAPPASEMRVATPRPELTPGKAALIGILARYSQVALGASLIEVQKLMYFLQEAGQELRLQYEPAVYGPYADNLRHVLKSVEGHYVIGFGDGSRSVQATEPIEVLPAASEEADRVLDEDPDVTSRMHRVLALVEGFESAYGLELLASVHWVANQADNGLPADPAEVTKSVQKWSRRKKRMFTDEHIRIAWKRLRDHDWLPRLPAPA